MLRIWGTILRPWRAVGDSLPRQWRHASHLGPLERLVHRSYAVVHLLGIGRVECDVFVALLKGLWINRNISFAFVFLISVANQVTLR